jgi:hypothetical protein
LNEERPRTMTKHELKAMFQELIAKIDYVDLKATKMKGLHLFSCKGTAGSNAVRIVAKDEADVEKVVLASMISGIIHVQVAASTGGSNLVGLEGLITTHDAKEFSSKFSELAHQRILVPDTNAIIDRYISSLSYTVGDDVIRNLSIAIPRFAILEIERIANRGNDKEKKDKVLSSIVEIQFLKGIGAKLLPELDDQTFEAFNRIADSHSADRWIRKEVRDAIIKETYLKEEDKVKTVTLFTADLVNALSADAEGIESFFVSRVDYDKTSTRSSNLKQLIQLIIMCSIFYTGIRVIIDRKRFLIRGVWEGKTTLEWSNDCVRVTELSPKKKGYHQYL